MGKHNENEKNRQGGPHDNSEVPEGVPYVFGVTGDERYLDESSPYHIKIDKEGVWYHGGEEIERKKIWLLFLEHLERDEKGKYLIHLGREKFYIQVEDTPFLVTGVTCVPASSSTRGHYLIRLNDGTTEVLRPETLRIGDGNVLYCEVKEEKFDARFNRPSYYALARYIECEQDTGRHYLLINGKRHYLDEGN